MAREWSLPETKALVEEHIALKEEEKVEVRTASEHWNKVAKKLREMGFNRSHKSCNKRWYRLEQCEVQIFSFNMEEGKHKNFWDLTRAERLEYRDKWPQLPSGDGIDKEIFDSLKRFSHQYEKKEIESERKDPAGVVDKEMILAEPKVELTRQSAPPPVLVATPRSTSASLSHPMVAGAELKRQEEPMDSQKQAKDLWPAPSEVQQPLSSQDALDGFKLQARELRRRRAAELRRNNRTVPYNSTHTTFMKASPSQLNTQNSPQVSEMTPFGTVTAVPPPDFLNQNLQPAVNSTPVVKENATPTKSPLQLKRPNPFTNQASQNNHRYVPAQPPQTGSSQVNFQSQNSTKAAQQLGERTFAKQHQGGHLPLLQSINSHMPLLQPEEGQMTQRGSLEEQLQIILGVNPGPLQAPQHCEQQLYKSPTMDGHRGPQFRRNMHQENGHQGSATASLLGAAIGGLGVQLGAIVKLMQSKNAAEQEFRDKMLMFVECMVVSLHTLAQVSARTSG